MNFFRQLTEKPWLPDQNGVADMHDGHVSATPAARIGLKMFLIIVGVLFFLLIVSYAGRMAFEDWRPVPHRVVRLTKPNLPVHRSVKLHLCLRAVAGASVTSTECTKKST